MALQRVLHTELSELLAGWGRDQLVVTGIYAHIGCMTTATEAFMRDVLVDPAVPARQRRRTVAADVPTETDDPWWEFSFGGTPNFVVCNTPAHKERLSRRSPSFTVTFQPRWVFDGVGPETRQGSAARKVIRRRLHDFDGMAPSAHLGDYGSPDNREWRQYFLPDNDTETAPSCPFAAGAGPKGPGVHPASPGDEA